MHARAHVDVRTDDMDVFDRLGKAFDAGDYFTDTLPIEDLHGEVLGSVDEPRDCGTKRSVQSKLRLVGTDKLHVRTNGGKALDALNIPRADSRHVGVHRHELNELGTRSLDLLHPGVLDGTVELDDVETGVGGKLHRRRVHEPQVRIEL